MSTEQAIDIPQGYKMTELGLLPEEWQVVRLGEVSSESYSGGTPSSKVPHYWNGKIPWTTTATINEKDVFLDKFIRFISEEGLRRSSSKIAPKRSVLVGTRVGVGKVVVTNFDIAINQDITVLIFTSDLVPEFFAYLAKTALVQKHFNDRKRGATIKGIPREDLLYLSIPLPPLPEQQAIAHVLQTVQDAKEKIEGVIQAAKELKKSLLKYLFSYGPVPVEDAEKVPLKKTEVGLIPEEWQVVRLGEVAERPTYGLTTTATSSLTPYKLLRISDIQDGRINWENVPFCEFDEPPKEKYILKKNDIVIARIGATTGKAIQYKKGPITLFASYLIRIRTKQPLESNFLINFFCTDFYWKQINEQKGGRLKKGVNIPIINNLLITLPSLHIQQRIADILSTVDERIESAENKKHALETLFKTLLSRLMSGKIRVNRSHGLVNEVEYEKG